MSGALEAILSDLIDKKVAEMEEPFQGLYLYKFYPYERQSFFLKPTIRFTVKSGLNDPFELSPRWMTLISDETLQKIAVYIELYTAQRLQDSENLINRMIENGKVPANMTVRNFRRTMRARMRGSEGAQIKQKIADEFRSYIPEQLVALRDSWSSVLSEFIMSTGIFSVTENSTSDQLWALYAGSGKGFVVELNCRHPFFLNATGSASLFKKVHYSDMKAEEFFRNPYYLFLVKGEKWSFEQEWRAIKDVSNCDLRIGDDVHIWNLPIGSISAIIFGYNYPEAEMLSHKNQILAFDKEIKIKRAIIDNDLAEIRVENIN